MLNSNKKVDNSCMTGRFVKILETILSILHLSLPRWFSWLDIINDCFPLQGRLGCWKQSLVGSLARIKENKSFQCIQVHIKFAGCLESDAPVGPVCWLRLRCTTERGFRNLSWEKNDMVGSWGNCWRNLHFICPTVMIRHDVGWSRVV